MFVEYYTHCHTPSYATPYVIGITRDNLDMDNKHNTDR